MTHILGQKKLERMCRCCGCTESNACVTDDGPCAWVLLDVGAPTGVCSACAVETEWDQEIIRAGCHPQIAEAMRQMLNSNA